MLRFISPVFSDPRRVAVICGAFLAFSFMSCDPISLSSPPPDYDTPAPVDLVVSADSVSGTLPFVIQIGYESLCPGDYRGMNIHLDSTVAFFSPIYHVYPQNPCNSKTSYKTAPETTAISVGNVLKIEASGRYGVAVKYVLTATQQLAHTHHLHYQFFDKSLNPLPGQTVNFHLPSRAPDSLFVITADSTGTWDTTFTDQSPTLQYGLNGFRLLSFDGSQQSGVMIIH